MATPNPIYAYKGYIYRAYGEKSYMQLNTFEMTDSDGRIDLTSYGPIDMNQFRQIV